MTGDTPDFDDEDGEIVDSVWDAIRRDAAGRDLLRRVADYLKVDLPGDA